MTKEEILDKIKRDLELRGRGPDTVHDYLLLVRIYHDYFDKPADQMRENEIRTFLHYLLTEKKDTAATVNTYNSALRFLYSESLDIILNLKNIPRVKQPRGIPELPTKDGYLNFGCLL